MRPMELAKIGYIAGFIPAWVLTALILGVFNQPLLYIIGFSFSDISAFLSLLFALDTGFCILVFAIIVRYTDWVNFKNDH